MKGAGFTIIELLLSMSILLVASAIAFSVAFGARRLYNADAARTDLNETMRSAIDLVITEIRQAGEGLPADFPAFELQSNANGDTLILRKGLVETVLQSCEDTSAGNQRVFIATPSGSGNCAESADLDTDGWPDNLQVFREYRLEHGDASDELENGFLFDPTNGATEWLQLQSEEEYEPNKWSVNVDPLTASFPAANQVRLYLLDETRFELDSSTGILRMKRNGSTTVQGIVDQIANFQVEFLMQDGSTVTSFASSDDWKEVQRVRFTLSAAREVGNRTITRSITADAFPRAILSN